MIFLKLSIRSNMKQWSRLWKAQGSMTSGLGGLSAFFLGEIFGSIEWDTWTPIPLQTCGNSRRHAITLEFCSGGGFTSSSSKWCVSSRENQFTLSVPKSVRLSHDPICRRYNYCHVGMSSSSWFDQNNLVWLLFPLVLRSTSASPPSFQSAAMIRFAPMIASIFGCTTGTMPFTYLGCLWIVHAHLYKISCLWFVGWSGISLLCSQWCSMVQNFRCLILDHLSTGFLVAALSTSAIESNKFSNDHANKRYGL